LVQRHGLGIERSNNQPVFDGDGHIHIYHQFDWLDESLFQT
jgi:hypothetical protein